MSEDEPDDWRTSRHSNPNGACVEVASGGQVRDSTDRGGPVLRVGPAAWRVFTEQLKGGNDGQARQ